MWHELMGIVIDNWDDMWTCRHQYEADKNKKAGAFALLIALILLPKYLKRYKDSIRRLKEATNRQLSISRQQNNHYLNVVQPQMIKALEYALAMPLPSKEIDCMEFDEKSKVISARTRQWYAEMSKRYTLCGDEGCDTWVDVIAAQAAVDTSYARYQYGVRRWERRVQLKRKLVQKAHAATMQQPTGISELFNVTTSIYSSMFQNAQSGLAGAMGNLGYGLGSIGLWF